MSARDAGRNARPVSDLSFVVPEGRYVPVYGPSGSGKTTVARLAAGLVPPSSGAVSFLGRPFSELTREECAVLRRREILTLSSLPVIRGELTVRQNLVMPPGSDPEDREMDLRRAQDALHEVGLSALANEAASELSFLEARLVELARAWVRWPSLIVADDPTLGIPRHTAEVVIDRLLDLADRGTAVLILTSRSCETHYGDEMLDLEDGRLIRHAWDEEEA